MKTPKNGMRPIHPGEVLREEFTKPLGLSANALAHDLDVTTNRVTAILNGSRSITADTALRLSRYFETTPDFWLGLQQEYELRSAEIKSAKAIAERVQSFSQRARGAVKGKKTIGHRGTLVSSRDVKYVSQPLRAAARKVGG